MTTLAATSGSQALWYLTRASGVVALLLLTATMLLGVLSANRWRSERWPRFAVADLHRNLTLLALVFIATHVLTTIVDGFAPIGLRDAFIPFASAYRPIWLGFGALALDLLLTLAVTSALRRRIGYRAWRLLHWAAYAIWPLALVHGLGSGSDARFDWMSLLTYACIALVGGAVAVRLMHSRPGLQLAAGGATVAVAILVVAWYRSGPAQHGWAARAGTPASLLKQAAATVRPVRQLAATTAAPAAGPFTGTVAGRMSSSGPDSFGDAAIAISLAERSSEPGLLKLTLWGSALDGGGLAMRTSQVTFQPAAGGSAYTGTVVALEGTRVVVDLTSPSGDRLRMSLQLRIDSQAGSITGTVRGTPNPSGRESE
jgi:Ferric reductase like transmembrane component